MSSISCAAVCLILGGDETGATRPKVEIDGLPPCVSVRAKLLLHPYQPSDQSSPFARQPLTLPSPSNALQFYNPHFTLPTLSSLSRRSLPYPDASVAPTRLPPPLAPSRASHRTSIHYEFPKDDRFSLPKFLTAPLHAKTPNTTV
ncbi:hypothetical protein IWX49DRAFT_554783 [Phyllosticta citricarpa]